MASIANCLVLILDIKNLPFTAVAAKGGFPFAAADAEAAPRKTNLPSSAGNFPSDGT
jgi:hypothetical protein